MKIEDTQKRTSPREMLANRIARFIKVNKLDNPFGGDVTLFRGGKMPCYTVAFSKPRVLDGTVSVYSPSFIQVRYQTGYRALPSNGNSVFTTEANAVLFLKLAFIDLKFDEAMEVPTK